MMSSLYIGATGLNTHSQGMSIVGNNIANVNTVGFKQSMALYQDLFSSTVTSQANNVTGLSQLGAGASLASARTIFTEGAFESSNTVTDIAVSNGNGYFGVVKDGQLLFTKAGNMRFDADGNLLDPSGYNLVGRKVTNGVVSSSYQPIQVDISEGSALLTNPAKASTAVSVFSNIGSTADMSDGSVFGMTQLWDGTSSPPLGNGQYSYSSPITVYDVNGAAHTMTVYYDYAGTENGVKLYEYVIGIDPSEDGSANAGTAAAGLLMSGTLSFSSSGALIGMTAFTPTGNDPANLSAWTPAALVNGLPAMQVNFAGAGGQQLTFNSGLNLSGYPDGISSPADALTNASAFYAASNGAVRESGATSAYSSTISTTNYFHQDGYAVGELRDLSIDEDGFIIARYTNGQTEELYQISLFRFKSQDGLRHEGNNHYSATNASGDPEEGVAGLENYGSILSQTLETSNVDIAREFTNMIITQRGFQANSKIITTSDTMLQRALELKR